LVLKIILIRAHIISVMHGALRVLNVT